MKTIPLPIETVALTGYTHKAILDYTDIAALGASTTGTIPLFPIAGTFEAGLTCQRCALNLITAFDFSDAGINSLLIEIGDGNSTARLCAQTQIAVDGTEILFFASGNTYAYPIADSIDAKFTCAGGGSPTLAEANAGQIEVYLRLVDLNDLEVVA